jgi:hypothetical protein
MIGSVKKKLEAAAVALAALFGSCVGASAQSLNSTEIVYASTFVPFDSSFAAPRESAGTFVSFPNNFKHVHHLALDSSRTVCASNDNNSDGDTSDPGETVHEEFNSAFFGLIIKNGFSQSVTVDYLRYQIFGVDGMVVRSRELRPFQPSRILPGRSAYVLFEFAEPTSAGRRRFIGTDTLLPLESTPRRVVYRVVGHTSQGNRVVLSRNDRVGFKQRIHCPNN